MAENKRELDVKIDVDVSDAITGLKALTREAKAATAALKEFEVTVAKSDGELIASITQDDAIVKDGYTVDFGKYIHVGLSVFSTEMLTEELAKREPTLDELVAGITAENRHGEIE